MNRTDDNVLVEGNETQLGTEAEELVHIMSAIDEQAPVLHVEFDEQAALRVFQTHIFCLPLAFSRNPLDERDDGHFVEWRRRKLLETFLRNERLQCKRRMYRAIKWDLHWATVLRVEVVKKLLSYEFMKIEEPLTK